MPMTENDARSVLPKVATTTATTLASAAADVPATEESNLFGKYELGKILGFGASGKVYQAMDVHTGQSVAVKAVSKQRVLKGGLTGHVKREISIMHRLRHPHIVRLHEVLATRSKVYFVMDFAKGGELFDKVSKGRFSEALSRRYFHQLISAVDYCHSKGIFHRDLKLENLLLDEEWNLKLTDFGLSAVTDQVRPDGRLHTLCGTPAYVAPEILSKKGYDGVKVDIWSCGIVLYIMNAGYLPFNDPNLVVMYKKIYKGEFRCPKWTSPDLKHLLNRLLDRNPETRITVDEILKHPWFKEGYNEIPCSQLFDELEELRDCAHTETNKYLNAFDLISFSSGIDLSGLLGLPCVSVEGERFVSAELPETIIKTVEEVGKAEGLKITKKKIFQVRLERQNGSFICVIWIHRLTDKLVLVDVRRRETATITDYEVWNEKLKAQLDRLIYRPDSTLALSRK